MSRKMTTIRLDNIVVDWFIINGANLNGTINRAMKCLVQRCMCDEKFARKVINIGKSYNYKIG